MKRSVCFLKAFEEAVGSLSEIVASDDLPTATIGGVCVAVSEEIATKLQPYIGEKIGLLRTDKDVRIKTPQKLLIVDTPDAA